MRLPRFPNLGAAAGASQLVKKTDPKPVSALPATATLQRQTDEAAAEQYQAGRLRNRARRGRIADLREGRPEHIGIVDGERIIDRQITDVPG